MHVLNRSDPSDIEEKTPYELFTGKMVHMKKFHSFGTGCYVHVPKQQRKKWDAKGQRGIFVGYSNEIDGLLVWIKPGNHIVRSKNVVFEPENAGKTLALFSDETEEQSDNSSDSSKD